MNIKEQIKQYITSQPEPKRSDMQELHQYILQALPKCKLWFLEEHNGHQGFTKVTKRQRCMQVITILN